MSDGIFSLVLLLGLFAYEKIYKSVYYVGGNPGGSEGYEYGIRLKLGREQLGKTADVFVKTPFFIFALPRARALKLSRPTGKGTVPKAPTV